MKLVFQTLCVALFLVSCQKNVTPDKEVVTAVVASDANSPLKSHTLTFTTDYPLQPGEVPPFSFTKTLYPDARVKSIKMLSRKNPIYPGFKKEAVELVGNFTYAANTGPTKDQSPHLAFLNGTSEVWEYYKTVTGTGAKRSISKTKVNWQFSINAQGFCTAIHDLSVIRPGNYPALIFEWNPNSTDQFMYVLKYFYDNAGMELRDQRKFYFGNIDDYGNIVGFHDGYGDPGFPQKGDAYFTISYDYNIPRGSKNYSFIPSQNLICQEFSLLEVMQWIPPPTHQRKAAAGIFRLQDGRLITQSQVYKSYKFDANGNQTSLTYGDNVLQKTTWHVQP